MGRPKKQKSPKHKRRENTRRKWREIWRALEEKLLGWLQQTWLLVVAFCTVAGLIGLWPRMTVQGPDQIDPSNPHPLSFRITNTGFIPIHQIQPMLGICGINIPDPSPTCGSYLFQPQWHANSLAMDEPYSFWVDDMMSVPYLDSADVSIRVSYQPWIVPIPMQREFRFTTKKTSDGKLYFIPIPIDR